MSEALAPVPTLVRDDRGISPVVLRLFDSRKWRDYIVLAVIGVLPLVYAVAIDNVKDRTALAAGCLPAKTVVYQGIGSTPNWWFFGLILPGALFVARKTAERLFCLSSRGVCPIAAGIGARVDPMVPPPEVENEHAGPEQQRVSDALRARVFSTNTLLVLLGVVILIHCVDMYPVLRAYVGRASVCVKEPDWTVMFQATTSITRTQNLGHVVVAYTSQFIAVFLGLLIFTLGLMHNAAYLRLVYQRYRADHRPPGESIVLWFADPSRCFGQQRLHELFDLQVSALLIAGEVIVISRYRNVSATTLADAWVDLGHQHEWSVGKILGNFGDFYNHVNLSALFPDKGQWMLAIGYLACLLIVALPSALKFLPFRWEQYRSGAAPAYLAQFTPLEAGHDPLEMNDDEITELAGKFARNSFWPAGDKKAELLFIFSFLVLIGVVVPPPLQETRTVLLYVAVLCVMAWGCMKLTFIGYRRALAHVDDRLIKVPKEK